MASLSGKMGPMSEPTGPAAFGRVEEDGTVFVLLPDGERRVGQVPDVDLAEALDFFVRRYYTLETEVKLLAKRIEQGSLPPEEARRSIAGLRTGIQEANAVGDLPGLLSQLEALSPVLAEQSETRKAERLKAQEETRAAKESMVAEAEKLAAGTDWRGGVNRFRALLDQWKELPRIDRATDDELWHRFSSARTTYTRRRKSQFAERAEQRESARKIKQELIDQARGLADSTDWGNTAAAFRELMSRWKAAGAAPRDIDDALWNEFRGLQDQFFTARNAALNEQDSEFQANLSAKEELLTTAEAQLLPVSDVRSARAGLRDFLTRYNEFGRVPREAIRPLENRVRALEQAIQTAEEAEWRRTDPVARERAQDTVATFQAQIDKLTDQAAAAADRGDARKEADLRGRIASLVEWRDQAAKALHEFEV